MAGGMDDAFVDTLRRATPGLAASEGYTSTPVAPDESLVSAPVRIHLNSAGAALPPRVVHDAVDGHLRLESRLGGYQAATQRRRDVARVYYDIAQLVGASTTCCPDDGGDDGTDAWSDEIACIENATRAFQILVHSWASSVAQQQHPHTKQPMSSTDTSAPPVIITFASEYGSNLVTIMQAAHRIDARVAVSPCNADGVADLAKLELLLQHVSRTVPQTQVLLSLTWVPTNGGAVQPAYEIGRLCTKYQVPYIIDACQAIGQIHIDVQELRCDALCVSARKFLRGPRGIGFLYVRSDGVFAQTEPIFLDVRGVDLIHPNADKKTTTPQSEHAVHKTEVENMMLDPIHAHMCYTTSKRVAKRFECWERPFALWLGLGAAARYILHDIGIDRAQTRISYLADYLRARLRALDADLRSQASSLDPPVGNAASIGQNPTVQHASPRRVIVRCVGEDGNRCGIVSFTVGDGTAANAADTQRRLLADYGIDTSVSPMRSTLVDMHGRRLDAVVRASVHYYNTESELLELVEAVRAIACAASGTLSAS